MHHGTCVMHVPWCMPGSQTCGFLWSRWRRKRSRHSRRMETRNFVYLVRGPCNACVSGMYGHYITMTSQWKRFHSVTSWWVQEIIGVCSAPFHHLNCCCSNQIHGASVQKKIIQLFPSQKMRLKIWSAKLSAISIRPDCVKKFKIG